MEKIKDQNTNLKLFRRLIVNGILLEKSMLILITLIFISLTASCLSEVKADAELSKLSKKLKETPEVPVLYSYLFYYMLHLFFGWIHNYLFFTNIHSIKLLIYKYLMKIYMNTSNESSNHTETGKTYSVIHKQTESTVFLLKNVILRLFYTSTYIVLFFKDMIKNEKIDISIKLAYFVVFIISVVFMISSCWISQIRKTRLIQAQHSNSHTLISIFMNLNIVKAFNNEEMEIKKFEKQMKSEVSLGSSFYQFETSSAVLFKILILFALVFPIIISANGKMNLFTDYDLLYSYFIHFNSLKRQINGFKKCIYKISDRFVDTYASSVIKISEPEKKHLSLECPLESILFEKFSISLHDKIIFSDFNMLVNPGDKIAITGRNGAGKSTIIKALLGMIKYQGSLKINEKEISKVWEKQLRNMISYVPQDPHLFNTTVMDNLKYGRNISDEEVVDICIKCGVHDIFKTLENGYFTLVGENAKNISGGQAQMINFMRAVIKDAPIFLLDEPTSNLDFAVSNVLLDKVFTILKSKTVFFSTHCPYHLPHFDKIINISDNTVKVFDGYSKFKEDPSFQFKL